jgi:large subunit ribosomal protein L5
MAYQPRLKVLYEEKIRPQLSEQFGYENIWEVPRPQKICVTMGISEATENFETLENAVNELALILGQRPSITRAKQSISAFGVREGQAVGCKATLRGSRMWEFGDRLFNVAIPRIRDFRGLPRSGFDGRGNYSMGIDDDLIFPELTYDDIEKTRGLCITIVTTACTDDEGMALLEAIGLPLAPE